MLIDWFTVAAQVINFLVLMALLKWLLYGRILKAMDKRESEIAQRFQEAGQEREGAEEERQRLGEEREELRLSREEELARAREEAGKEKERLLEEARREVDESIQAWRRSLQRDRGDLARRLARAASGQVMEVSRRAISGLTGRRELEGSVDAFLARLEAMDQDQKDEAAQALAEGKVELVSAGELNQTDRERLAEAVGSLAGREVGPEFRVDPELVQGLVLTTPGLRLSWSAADYLDELERAVTGILDREMGAGGGEAGAGAEND